LEAIAVRILILQIDRTAGYGPASRAIDRRGILSQKKNP
jgi:hypothetical protein